MVAHTAVFVVADIRKPIVKSKSQGYTGIWRNVELTAATDDQAGSVKIDEIFRIHIISNGLLANPVNILSRPNIKVVGKPKLPVPSYRTDFSRFKFYRKGNFQILEFVPDIVCGGYSDRRIVVRRRIDLRAFSIDRGNRDTCRKAVILCKIEVADQSVRKTECNTIPLAFFRFKPPKRWMCG